MKLWMNISAELATARKERAMLLTLLVLVPLLTGLACWPLRERAVLERLNLLAFGIVAALAVWLGAEVLAHGTVEAFGGFLRADALSALVVGLTAFVALVCGIYAVGYLRQEERAGKINARLLHRYYVLTPIFIGTMMAVPLVNNLGLLWVAIESTTLASVLLVRFYNQKSSLEAAWKYIVIGSAGIALALFGTVLTYFSAVQVIGEHAENGFNWSVLVQVADKCQPAAMRLGFVMILVGYGTKAGLVPMHTWKPDAYAEAPVPSAALLGAGVHQLRDLRHHALLHAGREMPRPRLHRPSSRVVRRCVHPCGRAVRAGAAEFSPAARLFEHRPRGHHGRGAWLWRQTRRAWRGAAHGLSRA